MNQEKELGLIHIYTGDGKGKTTASVGLAVRAVGSGFRVCIIQFMKGESEESGEITTIKGFDSVSVSRFGGNLLQKNHPPIETIKADISAGLQKARDAVESGTCELLILDEINVALSTGLADLGEVLELALLCKGKIELVMTGRNAPRKLMDIADYVTEFKMLKHPFEQGISARWGIEY